MHTRTPRFDLCRPVYVQGRTVVCAPPGRSKLRHARRFAREGASEEPYVAGLCRSDRSTIALRPDAVRYGARFLLVSLSAQRGAGGKAEVRMGILRETIYSNLLYHGKKP